MYICVRIRSGDQSGFRNGAVWCPFAVDLVFVGVDVVGFWVVPDRLVDQRQRVGVEAVVMVEQGDELAGRHRQRVFEAATMPPFSARCSTRIRGSRAAQASSSSLTRARGRAIVDKAELPVAEGLGEDRLDRRPEDVGRRLVDRRDDREARRRHRLTAAARLQHPQDRAGDPGEPRDRDPRDQPGHPLGMVLDDLQSPFDGAELGVAGDQEVAQAEDLLVAAGDLRVEFGRGAPDRVQRVDRISASGAEFSRVLERLGDPGRLAIEEPGAEARPRRHR